MNNRNCGCSYKYILLAFMTLRHRPYNVYMALITVLGIPASIYVASIIILFFQHLDEPVSWPLISASMFLTMSLYSFHRSSIKSSEGMQCRHKLALKFQNSFKRFSLVTAIISCVCFVVLNPSYLIFPLLGFIGVSFYSREIVWHSFFDCKILLKPLRNYPIIKPIAIGGGIAFFAWCLISLTAGVVSGPSVLLATIITAIFCSCDALICDFEDIEFDLSSGCKTLASQMQLKNVWLLTSLCVVLLSFVLSLKIQLIIICLIPLPFFKMFNTRLIVDLRPALVLLIAWLI